MVDSPDFAVELPGDSSVPVTGELQADVSNTAFQSLIGRFLLLLMIKASPGKIHEFAPPWNALDKGAIFGNELSLPAPLPWRVRHSAFHQHTDSIAESVIPYYLLTLARYMRTHYSQPFQSREYLA